MTSRRVARSAELPETEISLLRSAPVPERNARLRALYDAGWSLSSLASAFDPPRPRTTIRVWINSDNHQATAEKSTFISPRVPSPHRHPHPDPNSASRPVRPFSAPRRRRTGLSPDVAAQIATLAPLARRHRPRTSPGNPARVANEKLTRLTRELYSSGASIPELAEAAGVTYRAMYRRVRIR